MQHQAVPLLANKKLRYNRRDIQIDEQFEAVRPSDADILVKAKLARHVESSTAIPADNRSRIVTRDAGRSSTPRTVRELAEKLDRELAPGAPSIPQPAPVVLDDPGGVQFTAPPELGGPAKRANDLEPPPVPAKKKPASKNKAGNKRKPPSSTPVGDPPADA